VPSDNNDFTVESDASQVQAITFDFGNTLVRFGEREHNDILRRFHAFVERRVAPCSFERMAKLYVNIMDAQFRVYRPRLIENDMRERLEFLFWKLRGEPPTPELLQAGMAAHCAAAVASLSVPTELRPLLARLAESYRLGVISNYPYYEAVPAVLAAADVRQYFGSIVVSAAVGTFKPQRELFERAARELGVPLCELLHVGDDIAADVVGAMAAGARAAYLLEFTAGAQGRFLRYEGAELPAGAYVIQSLADLPRLLAEIERAGSTAVGG